MFVVDETTKTITLHRGDTGAVTVTLEGYDFTNVNAKVLFSMKSTGGTRVKDQIYDIDEHNQFTVNFANDDTDYLSAGQYEYDVRVVIDPIYDENGNIISGSEVITPDDPLPIYIKRTVGLI